ncbi:hypothetical protein [Bacillus xiapuensis]|uniref:Uncharacterized protein n=1 Tax=Bacillus xiapuensis TaxID=2014075 RepID=A0ABU6NBZ6_9BACI|nr:hypothetical protein [Bacillus xiapuensis]
METIIFMIILAVLSAVFGKAKGKKPQSRNKPFSFNQFDEFLDLFSEKNTPKRQNTFKTENEQKFVGKQQNIEKKYQQIKQETETFTIGVSQGPQKHNDEKIKPSVLENIDDHEIFSDSPDAQTLINGIIWSEVLGEPRAKRPYFSRRR